jgi:hypothetical protein
MDLQPSCNILPIIITVCKTSASQAETRWLYTDLDAIQTDSDATQLGLQHANFSQTTMATLPDGVLVMIAVQNSQTSLPELALSCKSLCRIARDELYTSINEGTATDKGYPRRLSILYHTLTRNARIANMVKRLKITVMERSIPIQVDTGILLVPSGSLIQTTEVQV